MSVNSANFPEIMSVSNFSQIHCYLEVMSMNFEAVFFIEMTSINYVGRSYSSTASIRQMTVSTTISPANQPCNFQMRVLHASGRIRTTRIFVRSDTHSNRPWFVPTSSAPQLATMFFLRAYPRCGSTDKRLHRPRHSTTVSSKRTDKSHRRPHRNYQQLKPKSRKWESFENHVEAYAGEITHWCTVQSSKRIVQLLRSPHREGLELVPVWQRAKQYAEQSQLLHNKSR